MALLPQDQRSQVMLLVTLVALVGAYGFWKYYYQPTSQQITAAQNEIDSLRIIVERAKEDLAQGTVDDLRQKVEQYRGMLALMRRLVPEQNEVPALIDDISTRAKVRGVSIGRIDPLPVEPGQPFNTYRYKLEILGHYDQLGEYLSDIASLSRVVVPQDVAIRLASQGSQKLLSDTVGALLEADFAIRTYVKAPGAAAPGGTGKKPAGKAGGI